MAHIQWFISFLAGNIFPYVCDRIYISELLNTNSLFWFGVASFSITENYANFFSN